MESAESAAYTVIEKLEIRKKIKETALKLILTINGKKFKKKAVKDKLEPFQQEDPKAEFLRYQEIKKLIKQFRD